MKKEDIKDLIILGGGPAGMTAAIYASRGMLDCAILEKVTLGGQLNYTEKIENYPGFTSISGFDLIEKFNSHLESLNVEVKLFQEIQKVDFSRKIKTITTLDNTYKAKAVLLCTGAGPRKLNIPGEKEYTGKGVSYCAICDGAFFKEKDICVVGGGNSAIEEAYYLTRFAHTVTIIHRRNELRANKSYQEKVLKNPKIKFLWDSVIEEITGNDKTITNIKIRNVKTNQISDIRMDGVFPYIGTKPNTELFENQIQLDSSGYIICNDKMETNVPGIYAAGDVRSKGLKQVVVSASDGAIAATYTIKYIDEVFKETKTPA